MLEKDIENLIAGYPEEFFPGESLKLEKQQAQLGNCRADIIFTDKFNRFIIVEVKRGLLSREAAGQIMEYYGLLKQSNPDRVIELVLCANVIPSERRLFLENAGIECKELGLALVQKVAQKYNYVFLDQQQLEEIKTSYTDDQILGDTSITIPKRSSDVKVWIFQANPKKYDILNALLDPSLDKDTWSINQYKNEIRKNDTALIWMSGNGAGIYAVAEIQTDPMFMEFNPEELDYWVEKPSEYKERLRVGITITKKLLNNPVLREELKKIPELKNLSIFRFHQGTNFPVTDAEWLVIKKFIEER